MSRCGDITTSYTARGLPRYEIVVWHDGLHKHQLIRGDNLHVVQQKAAARMRQWDEIWERKSHLQEARATRERLAQQKGEKRDCADSQTREAQERLGKLKGILLHTIDVNDAIEWDALKNLGDYPIAKPERPAPPQKPSPY